MVEERFNPTKFESVFDPFILNEIEINQEDKQLKKGKLKLVSVKNHIIKFYFEQNGSLKQFELFYPFDIKISDDCITLDYTIKKFAGNNILLYAYANTYKSDDPSPYLNTKIYIKKV